VDHRLLATISVVGAIVAGILFGIMLFVDQPTVLEVDFSPTGDAAAEVDADG
jgi:hypothetical protein